MRPLHLAMEGLTAFPERQEVDLSRLGLFCVTGATGAGKTTIFDAIAFALYGRAPRVGREVRRLVASAAREARVQLEFRSGEFEFRVARRLRLTPSGGTSQKALLERRDGSTWTALTDGPDAVARAVEELTGLGFDAFTRAVMLPQGDFAQLLSGPAKDRRSILVQLLDLGRVENAARRARAEGTALRGEERVLAETMSDELSDVTFDAIRAAQQELLRAGERHGVLQQAVREAREREAEARRAAEHGQRAVVIATALDELAAREHAANTEALELAPHVADAEQRLGRAQAARAAAEQVHTQTAAQVDELIAAHGDERGHATLRAALREADEARTEIEIAGRDGVAVAELVSETEAERDACLADLAHAERQALDHSRAALHAADIAAAEAAGELARARDRRQAAVDDLTRLERRELGASLRDALDSTDECPVCARSMAGAKPAPVPHDLAAHIADARAAVDDAERARVVAEAADRAAHAQSEAARQALLTIEHRLRDTPLPDGPARTMSIGIDEARAAADAAEAALAQARERAALVSGRRSGAEQRLRDADERLCAAFGRPLPVDVDLQLSRREEALADARRRLAEAAVAREEARTALDAEITAYDGMAAQRARRDAEAVSRTQEVQRLAGDLAALTDADLQADADPAALAAKARTWAEDIARGAEADLVAIISAAEAQGIPAANATSALDALDATAHNAHAEMVRRDTEVIALIERMRQKEARAKRLAGLARDAEIMESLGRHLEGNHFIEFLLAESVETLCVRASERLGEMSGGRYSMEMNEGTVGSLVVVDHHNADERRGVDTLSGGETFQASLALALALSESVADLGGPSRLDAVFVDEGFASLDAESLDLAIDALETVQAGGRMVGVITHLPQMAERIPEGVEVIKGLGGSSIITRAA